MTLSDFVLGAMTGVAGNTVYDSVKNILGSAQVFLKNSTHDKDQFESVLKTLLDDNEEIRKKLEELHQGKKTSGIHQEHYGTGDNVGGNKIVN